MRSCDPPAVVRRAGKGLANFDSIDDCAENEAWRKLFAVKPGLPLGVLGL
jgi:hypothetical protein